LLTPRRHVSTFLDVFSLLLQYVHSYVSCFFFSHAPEYGHVDTYRHFYTCQDFGLCTIGILIPRMCISYRTQAWWSKHSCRWLHFHFKIHVWVQSIVQSISQRNGDNTNATDGTWLSRFSF
jgi:hypothetical protein